MTKQQKRAMQKEKERIIKELKALHPELAHAKIEVVLKPKL